jgi:type I restriction enzyme S subunit
LAHNYPLGWTVKSLKTFAERVERRVSGAPEHVLMIASRTGFIPQADKYDRFMAGRSVEKYIDLHCGEFAYNKGNSLSYPCGCVYRLQGYHSAAVPFVYFCFAVNEEAAEPSYLEQFFAGGGLNTQLKGRINSGVRNNGLLNIRADEFFSCEVPLRTTFRAQELQLVGLAVGGSRGAPHRAPFAESRAGEPSLRGGRTQAAPQPGR